MYTNRKFKAREIALTVCFTALYAIFSFLPISPIIGLPGKAITAAAIMAPIMGIFLGPYLGILSTILGGIIGFFAGSFSPPSFISGVIAASCAGMLYTGKRSLCAFAYFSLLFLFSFYPFVGPVWLYLPLMWFQIVGFLLLISPLQSSAVKSLNSGNNSNNLQAFFIISLTSTLAGQIAGSLTFELLSWPIFLADMKAWEIYWRGLTILYPVERTIIALIASFMGAALYKVLKSANLVQFLNRAV